MYHANIRHRDIDRIGRRDEGDIRKMNNTGLDVETKVVLGHNNHNNIAERGYLPARFLRCNNDRTELRRDRDFVPIRYYDAGRDNNTGHTSGD